MKEITGNLWDFHAKGGWVVITTDGSIRKDGSCVMGRGVALEAKERFPSLPKIIGDSLYLNGNVPLAVKCFRIITLPVKFRWFERACLSLITDGVKELANIATKHSLTEVCLVRPGCGNGGLDWKDVKPILKKYLDDRFIVVERKRNGPT